jgi:hypothetical protein
MASGWREGKSLEAHLVACDDWQTINQHLLFAVGVKSDRNHVLHANP